MGCQWLCFGGVGSGVRTFKEGHELVWHLKKVRGLGLVYGELSEERRGDRKLVR